LDVFDETPVTLVAVPLIEAEVGAFAWLFVMPAVTGGWCEMGETDEELELQGFLLFDIGDRAINGLTLLSAELVCSRSGQRQFALLLIVLWRHHTTVEAVGVGVYEGQDVIGIHRVTIFLSVDVV
jgi:hypothetical protein